MQVALLFAWVPAMLVFVVGRQAARFPWKEFALAGLIGVLLAAILWVPMIHFWPNFAKDADPTLNTVQPLQYIPLNLVINSHDFFNTTEFGKTRLVFLYVNYIGWVPVLLALFAVLRAPRQERRLAWFFVVAMSLIFVLASGLPIKILRDVFNLSLTGIRFPALIASAVVPLLLGLSAWGLDLLFKLDRLTLRRPFAVAPRLAVTVKPLSLIVAGCVLLALLSVYDFSRTWLVTVRAIPPQQVLAAWKTPTVEWVYPPYGQAYWLPFGLNAGMKMVTITRPWQWKDRPPPDYAVESIWNLETAPPGPVLARFDELVVVAHPEAEYAYVETGSELIPCRARASAGDIDVDCQTDRAGTLIVQENNWSGWSAYRDGAPTDFIDQQWLSVSAPAGSHHYEFRYRPWDALLGLLLSLAGVGLALVLWWRSSR
jgi:hypothetical protein